ncbi:hypothetical protein NLU13_0503 [Sarocladium strictum]|uniref:Uncharacterized protein n=1 Tax=Sarocladium strictum TaxID=5046 RepID=A0AA39GPX9_SARSR|nr:hypothetical protein NLU13_0503 [Sarocladium strictum]
MTRRLPWKKSDAADGTPPTSVKRQRDSPRPLSIKRTVPSVLSPSTQTRLPVTPHRRRVANREFTRSPSTSPPPEPPKEELMIPGLEHDDRYRMVEDEFLAVARQFTTHLHRREYARLRTLAASQNAAAIREVERPVVAGSRPSADARRRGEARKREARQQKSVVVERDGGGGGGGEMMMTTGLLGLLESPRKDRRSIGVATGREGMRTRAGAGFAARDVRGARHGVLQDVGDETAEEEEASDGLELPSLRPDSPRGREDGSSAGGSRPRPVRDERPPSVAASVRRRETAVVEIDDDDDDDDDDDPFGMARRKARREKSREQLRRPHTPVKRDEDTMPSFL